MQPCSRPCRARQSFLMIYPCNATTGHIVASGPSNLRNLCGSGEKTGCRTHLCLQLLLLLWPLQGVTGAEKFGSSLPDGKKRVPKLGWILHHSEGCRQTDAEASELTLTALLAQVGHFLAARRHHLFAQHRTGDR